MKRVLFTLVSFFLLTSNAQANWFVGVNAGLMQTKFDAITVDQNPINIGLVGGYQFKRFINGLSAELEVTRSVAPGEIGDINGIEFDIESQGAY